MVDPTHFEEAVMGGRMTATVNANSDVCAIQKAGGDGVMQSVIMQCLRIASVKAGDITSKIKNAVSANLVKRHVFLALCLLTALLRSICDSESPLNQFLRIMENSKYKIAIIIMCLMGLDGP